MVFNKRPVRTAIDKKTGWRKRDIGRQGIFSTSGFYRDRVITGESITGLPISLYFRSPNWDEGSATINEFKALGYSVEEYASYDAGAEKAFKG